MKKACKEYNIKVEFLSSLARGLSYYNGNIFEIKVKEKEVKESICGGGSFMIEGIQSSGISFGIERLSNTAKISIDKKTILIVSLGKDKEAISLAENLRNEKINVNLMLDKSPSKALDYANSNQIPYTILIGEEEVKKKKFKLKNMKTGKEEMLSEKELIEKLRY